MVAVHAHFVHVVLEASRDFGETGPWDFARTVDADRWIAFSVEGHDVPNGVDES